VQIEAHSKNKPYLAALRVSGSIPFAWLQWRGVAAVVNSMETTIEQNKLPPSVLTKQQVKKERAEYLDDQGRECVIVAELRYDDECGNGHNTFSITAEVFDRHERIPHEVKAITKSGKSVWRGSCGCCHEDIAKHFPHLDRFIKWHLTSADGPMHYIANTVYLAGDWDCWGLRKGEFRQHISRGPYQNNGLEGVPNWELALPEGFSKDVYSPIKPEPVIIEWRACGKTGDGKERELAAARACAVWPDATDEELTAPGLEQRLIARLPALMAEFKRDIESLGFIY
jgi:hypothetical protein